MEWKVERVISCPSTMDLAKLKAKAGAPEGTAIVAEQMTSGRGTHGRTWHAPKGGLYMSFVLRDLQDPHLLTLALGNAVAEVLEVAGTDPKLKWVNDVWVGGKKIAGILVEGEATGKHIDFLVAGVGINVNGHAREFPKGLRDIPTTLEDELQCDSCIPDLEAVLLASLASWVDKVRQGRNQEVVTAFRQRDALLGRKVRVEEAGPAPAEGTADGIDDQGHFRLKANGKVQTFATGSIRLA